MIETEEAHRSERKRDLGGETERKRDIRGERERELGRGEKLEKKI